MKKIYFICFLTLVLISCQSNRTSKSSLVDSATSRSGQNVIPADFKFSFFISGDGAELGTIDSWTVDTSGVMVVHSSHRVAAGKLESIKAQAALDPVDMDTLRMLIWNGKLQTLDSADLTQQCAGDEHFLIRIVPLSIARPVTLSFDACAADYNLLLGQQRPYFRKFMDWWGRMRVKYRPSRGE